MTHLSKDLDKICLNWCPVANICERDHFCESMHKIRKLVIKISEFQDYYDKE